MEVAVAYESVNESLAVYCEVSGIEYVESAGLELSDCLFNSLNFTVNVALLVDNFPMPFLGGIHMANFSGFF